MSNSLDMFRLEDGEDPEKYMKKWLVEGYLGELKKTVDNESYEILVKYFVEKNMEAIAEVIKRLYANKSKLESQMIYIKSELERISDENQKLKAKSLHEEAYNADKLRMKELYLSGMSLRAIAREFGCEHNAVKRKLRKMGVEIRK